MGTRSVVRVERVLTPGRGVFKNKRKGPVTTGEKALLAEFLTDQTAAVTNQQVTALAKVMRRSKEIVIRELEAARDSFVESAQDYVDIHKKATQQALLNADPKSLDVATRAAQWAIEKISGEGIRLVEKADKGPSGSSIMIGIKLGGLNDPQNTPFLPPSENPSKTQY